MMRTVTALVSGEERNLNTTPTDHTALAESFQPQGNISHKAASQASASEALRRRAMVWEVGWDQGT